MTLFHLVGSLDSHWGGLPRLVVALASAQARSGKDVWVGYYGERPPDERLLEWGSGPDLPETLHFYSIPVHRFSFSSVPLKQILKDRSVEWLQIHGCWEPQLHVAMRVAMTLGIPYGVAPHSMLHPWHEKHHRCLKWGIRKCLGVEKLWKQASGIQVMTQSEAMDWEILFGKTDRLHIIPNGIFPDQDPGDSGQPHPNLPGTPFLLFLGRLAPQKNPTLVLETFFRLSDRFPDLHLVMAGPDGGLQPELEKRAKESGCADRIHFPGMLNGQAKWDAFHRCAAFCLPSHAEGFSLALLEACLAKAPCFISRACCFPELVEGKGAVEVSDDPFEFVENVEKVLLNPENAKQMGNQAHQLVTSHYRWEQSVEKFDRMIQHAAK